MGLQSVFKINGSGMKAQMLRLEVLSSNIANINATRTPEGGPYRRRDVVFEEVPTAGSFDEALGAASQSIGSGVEVTKVIEDQSPFRKKFDPGHPDADAEGFVSLPNVDVVAEMVNIQEASRSYEANIAVLLAVKNMIAKTFEISRR